MRFLFLIVFLSFLSSSLLLIDARTNWPASVYSRAKQLVSQMTLDEKIQLVHGNGEIGHYIGNINSISRLNIPPINLEDGPQGVADGTTLVTQWPSTLSVVSSWDVELYEKFGAAMAAEQAAKGTNILLGPMVNLARVPQGGRNFESVGEDPVIGSQYAYYLIKGIQEGGSNMMGCIKHGFFNTQEYERQSVSEIVPLRAARELYYPALQAAVDAGVGSMMCSYNRINGTYACENPNTIQWFKSSEDEGGAGFDGFVMSDWFATHSTVASAAAGLDQEMPIGLFFGEGLKLSVQLGEVSEDRLNDMVERIIRAMAATNILDNYPQGNLSANATSDEHALLAKQLAEASMVLLKNDDNLVPLDPLSFIKGGQSLVIIGDEKTVAGGGSGGVTSSYTVTPYAGIAQRLLKTPGAQSRPVNCTLYDNTDFYQPGNTEVYATDANDCCAKCSSIAECNYFTFSWPNSCWIKFSDEGKRESLGMTAGSCSPLPFRLSYNSGVSNISDAVIAAKNNDYVVVVVATTSQEGSDRPDLSLGNNQDQLVEALIEANPNTVVIVRSAGAVTLPWANKAKTIFWQGMSGQESGNAIASVLFGDINPSGRLPLSFPSSLSDTWLTTTEQYPGVQGSSGFLESHYTEELLMGYRWYDAKNISPAFIFGHGLSYTTFNYHSLSINGAITSTSDITISLSITNTGKRDGDEIIQYYIAYPDNAGEPPKVLRRFQKQFISAGKTITIQEKLSIKDVQIFDVTINNWKQIKGTFKLLIGASSTDIRASADFQSN